MQAQCLHCLLVIQQVFDISLGSNMNLSLGILAAVKHLPVLHHRLVYIFISCHLSLFAILEFVLKKKKKNNNIEFTCFKDMYGKL